MSSTAEVHAMVSSTLFLSVLQREQSVKICASLIEESKVEETMVCTSAMDDIIHRFFRRAVSRLILNVETWRLDVSHYFWLLFEIQASKHDSVTSATDPFQKSACSARRYKNSTHSYDTTIETLGSSWCLLSQLKANCLKLQLAGRQV